MNDWGELKLTQIGANDFWNLFDELCDDNSRFLFNRATILEAYKNGNLYGLTVDETDDMHKRNAGADLIFCQSMFRNLYLLPCFCVKEDNKAIIIWTHTRARNMGFATKLIKLLGIKYAYDFREKSAI